MGMERSALERESKCLRVDANQGCEGHEGVRKQRFQSGSSQTRLASQFHSGMEDRSFLSQVLDAQSNRVRGLGDMEDIVMIHSKKGGDMHAFFSPIDALFSRACLLIREYIGMTLTPGSVGHFSHDGFQLLIILVKTKEEAHGIER